ncbi:MAG TPA: PilZ domain-containing protein [Phycisphaerae bacterium]|nr:PilZ domain-containing protein [Phycisphaerae bacterium]HRR85596.1 PilZ domain-containing protein [Phycisphaerae bacterium]
MIVTEQQFGLLGLTNEQLNALLDDMDKACKETKASEHRRSIRKPFRSVNVKVSILDKASREAVSFKVPTRNISLHGLAFLHHRMLQVGQMLRIQIPFRKGYTVELLARVARCRHISGMIHEIGAEFKGRLSGHVISNEDEAAQTLESAAPEPPLADV